MPIFNKKLHDMAIKIGPFMLWNRGGASLEQFFVQILLL